MPGLLFYINISSLVSSLSYSSPGITIFPSTKYSTSFITPYTITAAPTI